jgi:predicted ATPase/GAF domain-containing protein
VTLSIIQAHVVKQDRSFQLKRVFTSDGERYLVKFSLHQNSRTEQALLEREFDAITQIQSRVTLNPIRLAALGDRAGIYYEDFDGAPLATTHGRSFDAADFLERAKALCTVLEECHARSFLVLGFSRGSFLQHQKSQLIVLADAAFAQPAGVRKFVEREWIESSYLSYVAPEVIGRTSQPFDARADLYALGVLLYELISGRVPFASIDPFEVMFCHLAKRPSSLLECGIQVPEWLNSIVMRLLAKSPDERFESVSDLSAALQASSGAIYPLQSEPRPVVLASRSLIFDDRVWGRHDLLRHLETRVQGPRSRQEVLFLEGNAGIGKSSALREIRRLSAPSQQCYGKFSQTGPPVPLSGWSAALKELADVHLTRSRAELEGWRRQVLNVLGDLASLIAVLVPEWSSLLKVPTRAGPDPLDTSLNRLAMAIHRLLGCYADANAPIVLQMDDIQWADASSLRILELVLTAPDAINLVVLLSVRSTDESGAETPEVTKFKHTLRESGVSFEVVTMPPWTESELAEFIDGTLNCGASEALDLALLIYPKAGGNPFFVRELLKLLVNQGALTFDESEKRWAWNREATALLPITDNVVAFLSDKLERLPPPLKAALGIAACLGAEFSETDFGIASEMDERAAAVSLVHALNEGLLAITTGRKDRQYREDASTCFAFVHDRILEASRKLLSADERSEVCLRTARVLMRAMDRKSVGEASYELAGYFNTAERILTSVDDRYMAATLNLQAARMAKVHGAFSQGLDFARFGLLFLKIEARDAWLEQPELCRSLHEETAELALLNGELNLMHSLCDLVLGRVTDPLQRALIYDVRICGLKAEKKFILAVEAALEILAELGVRFPRKPRRFHAIVGFLLTRRRVLAQSVEKLAKLPVMAEPRVKAAARIIQSVYPAAYLGRPDLFPLLVYQHINDSLTHGNEDYSAATYAALAIVFCGMGDLDNARRLGELGLALLKEFKAEHLKARVYMAYYQFVFPWSHHLREAEPHYREAIRSGLERGDFEYACYTMASESLAALYSGANLSVCVREFERSLALIRSLGQERSILLQDLLCQALSDLRDGPSHGGLLSGPFYDQQKELPRCFDPMDENLVFHNHMLRTVIAVFLGLTSEALKATDLARKHLEAGAFGNYIGAVYTFFEALVLLSDEAQKVSGTRRRAARNLRKLERWAREGSMNFLHRYHLVRAELAARSEPAEVAALHYERAIALAKSNGYVHEAALAQEYAARFYFRKGLTNVSQHYLRDACSSYAQWGATAVTRRLEQQLEYPYLFTPATEQDPGGQMRASRASFAETLDYRVLLKSSQAISSEILLPRLIERLLKAMIEHAGAQRGLLIIERRGELYIEAEADVDSPNIEFPEREEVETTTRVPRAIVQYVARTERALVLGDASRDGLFVDDVYVRTHKPKSVLCAPVSYQGKLIGAAYLENKRVSYVFTEARIEMIGLLAGQAAISIANARFHALQLEAMQARINPHFLFNALSSIADLTVEDGRRAETAIVRLSRLYQHILTSGASDLVSLDQELEIVHHYLELEKLRFGDLLVFCIDKQGDSSQVQLPGLIIQPLVENCIRHAIAPRPSVGHVNVHVAVGKRCNVVVEDDGDGISRATHGTGFGLRSVQQRLNLVYGEDFSVAITRTTGYRVEFDIPLMPHSEMGGSER